MGTWLLKVKRQRARRKPGGVEGFLVAVPCDREGRPLPGLERGPVEARRCAAPGFGAVRRANRTERPRGRTIPPERAAGVQSRRGTTPPPAQRGEAGPPRGFRGGAAERVFWRDQRGPCFSREQRGGVSFRQGRIRSSEHISQGEPWAKQSRGGGRFQRSGRPGFGRAGERFRRQHSGARVGRRNVAARRSGWRRGGGTRERVRRGQSLAEVFGSGGASGGCFFSRRSGDGGEGAGDSADRTKAEAGGASRTIRRRT